MKIYCEKLVGKTIPTGWIVCWTKLPSWKKYYSVFITKNKAMIAARLIRKTQSKDLAVTVMYFHKNIYEVIGPDYILYGEVKP